MSSTVTSTHGRVATHFSIAVSDSDGTDVAQVYTAPGTTASDQVRYPTWSPSGASISFVEGLPPISTWYGSSTNYGDYAIKAVDVSILSGVATGSNSRTICSYTSSDHMVIVEQRWSPTTSVNKIAFIGVTPSGWGIYTVPASGGTPTRIYLASSNAKINPGPLEANAIGWSNDGSQIAFAERDSASDGTISYAIKIINADGSGTPTVLDEGSDHALGGVQWSHSGALNQDQLSYYRTTVTVNPSVSDFYIYRVSTAAGSTPSQVAATGLAAFWSPDNTELIYQDYSNATSPVLKKVDVASGTTTSLSITTGNYFSNHGDWKQP